MLDGKTAASRTNQFLQTLKRSQCFECHINLAANCREIPSTNDKTEKTILIASLLHQLQRFSFVSTANRICFGF